MADNPFSDCATRADHLRRFIDLENELAPAEMFEIWQNRKSYRDEIASLAEKNLVRMKPGASYIRPYRREKIAANVIFYAAPGKAAGARSLLICFCGIVNRLMLPIPVFLQFIPETLLDVVILRDPTGSGFIRGVPGFGRDLPEVMKKLESSVNFASYRDIRCFGTSSGGGPALYTGFMVDAERAVSICGRHRSLPARVSETLKQPEGFNGYEFDTMIRDTPGAAGTKLFAVYGKLSRYDAEGAQSLKDRLPACRLVAVKHLADHNVLLYLLDKGELTGFMNDIVFGRGAPQMPEETNAS
jgi:hypothetical protein